ncbi:MAG: hypothetical protein ABI579_03435 [Candidatus Sumerlaeota bacterium]
MATAQIIGLMPRFTKLVDWERVTGVEGATRGILKELLIANRTIALPERPGEPLVITLALMAKSGEATTGLVSFGDTLELQKIESVGSTRVEEIEPPLGKGTKLHLLRFTPPLAVNAVARATFTLVPTVRGKRLWERAYDKRFYRLSGLGEWYGASAFINFNNAIAFVMSNESPFEITAPSAGTLQWRAGAAQVSTLPDSRVQIMQPLADNPSKLIAANMMEVPPGGADMLPVTFVLQPQRKKLAAELHKIFATPFKRIYRLFGKPPESLYLYEVPENDPGDAMAMPSSTLEVLEALLPNFQDYDQPTASQFYESFVPNHLGLVNEIFTKSFSRIDNADLLRDALVYYLHTHGLEGGLQEFGYDSARKDDILIPWIYARHHSDPYDVARANADDWEGPAIGIETMNRKKPISNKRLEAFHHLLRGQIGDDAFARAIRKLTQDHRGEPLTIELYRKVMEAEHGDSLGWLFDEWLVDGVLPRYEISDAQALLIENAETRALEYTTQLTIRNIGTGRMEVPWILVTEQDSVHGKEWLDTGAKKELLIKSLDRPVAFELDPDGWIPQITLTGKGDGTDHARVVFKTVREL